MSTRLLLFCSALLVFADVALGDGVYQRTRDGKTLVWNNDPKPGDEATWSGDRDREGYARGFGTLIWYTLDSQTGSPDPVLYARYWGNMVRGKLDGLVNVHSKKKTHHAIFVDGARLTHWAAGPASSHLSAEARAAIAKQNMAREPEAPAEGPSLPAHEPVRSPERSGEPSSTREEVQVSTRQNVAREPQAPVEGPSSPQQESVRSPARSAGPRSTEEEQVQVSIFPSTTIEWLQSASDIDDSLRMLVWPPRSLSWKP